MAVANPTPANTTLATLVTAGQVTRPQLWDLRARRSRETANYFSSAETAVDDPEGPDGLVVTKTETSAGNGHQVNFRTISGFYGEGKRGESLFAEATDFERNNFGEYSAYVGVYRNATSWNEFTNEEAAITKELESGTPESLGNWLGRLMTETIDIRVRDKADSSSLFTANSKGLNGLLSSDILDLNNMIAVKGQMSTLGGKAARVGMIGKQPVHKYVWGPVTEVATTLKMSSDYQGLLKYSNTGIDYLLKGEIATLDDQIVKPYEVINHDGYGPIGSARFPMAQLGEAIAAGTAALTMKFGGDATGAARTDLLYTKAFLGYAYNWVPDRTTEVLASNPFLGGSDFTPAKYLMVVNPPNPSGSEPANGVGYYQYTTGNNGNQIVCTKRLSATGGVFGGTNTAVATFGTGSITPTLVATYGATFAEDHPIGAMVYQCNIKGVPLAFTPCYGAGGIIRPYGITKQRRGKETKEDGFIYQSFIRSYFGTQLRYDRRSRTPGVAVIAHAVKIPHHILPVVTA